MNLKSLIISYLKELDRFVLRLLIVCWLIRTILEPKMNEAWTRIKMNGVTHMSSVGLRLFTIQHLAMPGTRRFIIIRNYHVIIWSPSAGNDLQYANPHKLTRATASIKWQTWKLISMYPLHKKMRQKHSERDGMPPIRNGMSRPIWTLRFLHNGSPNTVRWNRPQQRRVNQDLRLHPPRTVLQPIMPPLAR